MGVGSLDLHPIMSGFGSRVAVDSPSPSSRRWWTFLESTPRPLTFANMLAITFRRAVHFVVCSVNTASTDVMAQRIEVLCVLWWWT